MTIGNAIKERRKMLKITQRTLAELAGVGINTLTKIERNEGNPSLDVLEQDSRHAGAGTADRHQKQR